MFKKVKLIGALLLIISALSLTACQNNVGPQERSGNWTLLAAESGMTYVTVKNGNLGEINTFRTINGSVKTDGQSYLRLTNTPSQRPPQS